MTDRYEKIRKALAMEPTHGPWHATKPEPHGTEVRGPVQVSLAWCGGATTVGEEGCYSIGAAEAAANAHFIAACDPDTIRELLAERDALAAEVERLNQILGRIVACDGDSAVTIRAGTDAFAAAREYLRRNRAALAEENKA